jgi:hypothetical protein
MTFWVDRRGGAWVRFGPVLEHNCLFTMAVVLRIRVSELSPTFLYDGRL